MGFKKRLGLLVSLVLTVVMLGQTVFMAWDDYTRDRDVLRRQADLLADNQAALLSEPVWNFEFPAMEKALSALTRLPDFRQATLRYPDGRILMEIGQLVTDEPVIRVKRDLLHEQAEGPIGVLVVAFAGASVSEAFWNAMGRNLGLLVVTLIVANGAILLAFSLVSRPLDRVRESVLALAEGDLETEIPCTRRQDEVGELARAVDKLKTTARSLHDLQTSLAEQIARQTEDLRRARDKAEAGVQARDLFLSTVSHELRTPLTAVRGAVGMLTLPDAGSLTPKGRELLGIAERNCQRLSELINEILDSQALASGDFALRPQRLDLAVLVKDAINRIESFASQQGVRIHVGRIEAPAWVDADPDRMMLALRHVLHNAVKFSRSGTQVLVSLLREGKGYCVEVEDQGEGISREVRERVFERFSRADEGLDRNQGGAGLGLSLVRALVELHGGSVSFETISADSLEELHNGLTPHTGTTFFIRLPAAASLESAGDQPLAS
ncbi:MAG: HAMP domain-containing protein [Gammaproteobacteria bacterium]|nr:MAG: HAMP domain-containing protein [Gammaproteobacteria bacterium]